jgi:RNA polymerase sigma factor (TIGR02999 family)
MADVTQLLGAIESGDPQAADELLPLVYEELRRLAAAKMAREDSAQTLQPTALVHEAWLRLSGENHSWANRRHFFSAAAEAMRRILIDRARRRGRVRHGGQLQRTSIDDLDLAIDTDDDLLELVNDSLERLADHDAVGAQLVKLRFFVGLSIVEAADVLGFSEATAKRAWAYARAWLYAEMKRQL